LDTQDLEARVKSMYREVAEEPEKEFHFETGRGLAERLGYDTEDLDRIPGGAIESFAGVGHFFDLAGVSPGETVLDLGSGSGTGVFVAALRAGEQGKVIGIDMTDEQLAKSARLAEEAGFDNVEFRKSYIEHLPIDDGSIDVVISNGVINLSPDKDQVFREAARVLKSGGRFAIADIVTKEQLPEGVTCDASLWAACIGGAMQRDDYRESICHAWLEIRTLRDEPEYRFISDQAQGATEKYGVRAVSLLAVKP
jgi:SAM-dependent methyltransferase